MHPALTPGWALRALKFRDRARILPDQMAGARLVFLSGNRISWQRLESALTLIVCALRQPGVS